MGTCQAPVGIHEDIEITDGAIRGYRRLLSAVGGRLRTRGCEDGGLICEDRTRRAHPIIWRIAPDGGVLPDSRYDFRLRTFVTASLPDGI